MHLQVGDVATATTLYVDTLGFAMTANAPGALFASAGGVRRPSHLGKAPDAEASTHHQECAPQARLIARNRSASYLMGYATPETV
ncbi:hypothetical protein [Cryobacterium sp. TMT4-31]|uniref:hypothetical protein n=1 Tax=Cryobacterium sp. TMT4-31 TaxID=1259259 RepID=UPI003513ABDD